MVSWVCLRAMAVLAVSSPDRGRILPKGLEFNHNCMGDAGGEAHLVSPPNFCSPSPAPLSIPLGLWCSRTWEVPFPGMLGTWPHILAGMTFISKLTLNLLWGLLIFWLPQYCVSYILQTRRNSDFTLIGDLRAVAIRSFVVLIHSFVHKTCVKCLLCVRLCVRLCGT